MMPHVSGAPLARVVRDEMERLGLSQSQLADRASLSQSLVSSLLSGGSREFRVSTLMKLSRALGLELSDLVEAQQVSVANPDVSEIEASVKNLPDVLLAQDPVVQRQVLSYVRRVVPLPTGVEHRQSSDDRAPDEGAAQSGTTERGQT